MHGSFEEILQMASFLYFVPNPKMGKVPQNGTKYPKVRKTCNGIMLYLRQSSSRNCTQIISEKFKDLLFLLLYPQNWGNVHSGTECT